MRGGLECRARPVPLPLPPGPLPVTQVKHHCLVGCAPADTALPLSFDAACCSSREPRRAHVWAMHSYITLTLVTLQLPPGVGASTACQQLPLPSPLCHHSRGLDAVVRLDVVQAQRLGRLLNSFQQLLGLSCMDDLGLQGVTGACAQGGDARHRRADLCIHREVCGQGEGRDK